MDLPVAFYLTAIAAILLTGVSKSGFGGGLGVMSVPVMSLFVTPQLAAAVLMPILLAMDILLVVHYRKSWNRQVVFGLLPGAAFGLALGAITFQWMDAELVKLAIGLLALIFVMQFLWAGRKATTAPAPHRTGRALATVSGFASYIAHAGGPPVKGYLLSQNLDKTQFVATNTMFFFTLTAVKTLAYGAFGTLSLGSLTISLWLAPTLFVGIALGTWLHGRINQGLFIKIVYGFLTLTALKLLSDSAPMIWG